MLLHNNRLNAATLDRLVGIFRSEGFCFVSIAQAEADEVYRASSALATRFGPMWGYRGARVRRVRVDGSLEQEPPKWLQDCAKEGIANDQQRSIGDTRFPIFHPKSRKSMRR